MTSTAPTGKDAETATLPKSRGPLSEAVISKLRHHESARGWIPPKAIRPTDAYGEDLAVALHTCYELHYRGFEGVDPEWEWQPDLIGFRGELERTFLTALRTDVRGGAEVSQALDPLLVEAVPGYGVSHHLRDRGPWWQLREYLVHRSIYHLKEADPHIWVVPRLRGHAKAALVSVEFDEFGAGRGENVHAQLYADLLSHAGLDAGYLHYFDDVPAPQINIVNLMSMLGLHRSLRGALVGHFTAAEVSTSPSAQRMVAALDRLEAAPECTRFFAEHIEADAVHEQVMRHDVIGDLLDREPELAADVVFGIQATELLEGKLAAHLLAAWSRDTTSLRGSGGTDRS
ncbi:iron-containing redox enzyme family protein [Parasphingorhabdus pacifica]